MAYDNHSTFRTAPGPAFQVPPVGLFISFAVPPPAQVYPSEVRDLRVHVAELREQMSALEADKGRLALENTNLQEALKRIEEESLQQKEASVKEKEKLIQEREGLRQNKSDAERRNVKLLNQTQEYKRRVDRLERNVERLREHRCGLPASLAEALAPLNFDTMPTPKVIEIEVRKPSPNTPHYDSLERYDFSTITGKKTEKVSTLAAQSTTGFSLRLTCRGYNAEENGRKANGGGVGVRKRKLQRGNSHSERL